MVHGTRGLLLGVSPIENFCGPEDRPKWPFDHRHHQYTALGDQASGCVFRQPANKAVDRVNSPEARHRRIRFGAPKRALIDNGRNRAQVLRTPPFLGRRCGSQNPACGRSPARGGLQLGYNRKPSSDRLRGNSYSGVNRLGSANIRSAILRRFSCASPSVMQSGSAFSPRP